MSDKFLLYGKAAERHCYQWSEPSVSLSCARDRGLVLRASTRPKFRDLFSPVEHWLCCVAIDYRCLAIDFFDLFPAPSHTGDFDLSILRDPENSRHIG